MGFLEIVTAVSALCGVIGSIFGMKKNIEAKRARGDKIEAEFIAEELKAVTAVICDKIEEAKGEGSADAGRLITHKILDEGTKIANKVDTALDLIKEYRK